MDKQDLTLNNHSRVDKLYNTTNHQAIGHRQGGFIFRRYIWRSINHIT